MAVAMQRMGIADPPRFCEQGAQHAVLPLALWTCVQLYGEMHTAHNSTSPAVRDAST